MSRHQLQMNIATVHTCPVSVLCNIKLPNTIISPLKPKHTLPSNQSVFCLKLNKHLPPIEFSLIHHPLVISDQVNVYPVISHPAPILPYLSLQ